jgi:hypothetical protein
MLSVVWLGGRQQTSYRKDADRVRYIRTAVLWKAEAVLNATPSEAM